MISCIAIEMIHNDSPSPKYVQTTKSYSLIPPQNK